MIVEPTSRQRRILENMQQGNPIWEVSGEDHCTVYDEKTRRDRMVRQKEVEQMEQAGWVRRVPNTSRSRLESWQVTEQGRAAAARATRRSKRPVL